MCESRRTKSDSRGGNRAIAVGKHTARSSKCQRGDLPCELTEPMGCSAGCERALPPIEWRCRSRELRCEHSGTKGVRRLAYLHGVQHAPRAPMGWRGTRHRVGRSYSPRCNRSCCTRPTEFACWSPEARRKSAKIRQPCKRDRLMQSVTDRRTHTQTHALKS